jgi:hypothetical protein
MACTERLWRRSSEQLVLTYVERNKLPETAGYAADCARSMLRGSNKLLQLTGTARLCPTIYICRHLLFVKPLSSSTK